MQTNILWAGREYFSLENCLVTANDRGIEVCSTIVGTYEGKIYKVCYTIRTNTHWQTVYAEIRSRHSDQQQHIILESDGKGSWMLNGKYAPAFNGCTDIDLPLTPFTNSLPINRLHLEKQHTEQIQVVYIDLLAQEITNVRQKYIRLSDTVYHYENIPNDFEADIVVDQQGFVVDYPDLFVQKTKAESNYAAD